MRRPELRWPALDEAQAEVDVVAGDLEPLVETADLLEARALDHQARSGHGRHLALHAMQIEIDGIVWIHALEEVHRSAAIADEEDAAVLDPTVRIQQQRTNSAYLRPRGFASQLGQPVGVDDLDVVVQEEQ